MVAFAAGSMMLMGIGILVVWTGDIVRGDKVDRSRGLFRARENDDGSLLWPHWVAEYTTALLLIAAGVGLLADTGWAATVSALALGALFYTSVNSLGWALATRERHAYAVPMIIGLVVSVVFGIWLIGR